MRLTKVKPIVRCLGIESMFWGDKLVLTDQILPTYLTGNKTPRGKGIVMANRILIVDDELSLREMLKDVLEESGHQAEVAPSAERALEMMENYDPDVIVSDIWMPGMNGHEFCQTVREISDASILLMSGVSSEISILQKKQIDADDFLIKPFDVENFVERIEALLEKRQRSTDSPSDDDEHRMLAMYQGLSQAKKETFLKEARRIAEVD